MYNDDISVEDAADLMYGIEIVADEYATRKLRELVKLKLLPNNITLPTGLYKKTPKQTFIKIVEMVKEMIQGLDYKNSEKLSFKLGDLKLEDLCNDIMKNKLCKLLILKLPYNYDLDTFKHKLSVYKIKRVLFVFINI